MSATDEVRRGARNGRARKVPSKRVAIAAARVLVAADKKRGVTTSPAVRELAAESAATATAIASAEGHTGKAD